MKIAVTSQNRKTITEHAGKCRKFWIYDINAGAVTNRNLIELPMEQSFHANHHQLPSELTEIQVLITGGMGSGLHLRLRQHGIEPLITSEEDPDVAVAAYLSGNLANRASGFRAACRHPH